MGNLLCHYLHKGDDWCIRKVLAECLNFVHLGVQLRSRRLVFLVFVRIVMTVECNLVDASGVKGTERALSSS